MEFFTDGSKKPDARAVGAAAVIRRGEEWQETRTILDPIATIFTVEAVAIALKNIYRTRNRKQ